MSAYAVSQNQIVIARCYFFFGSMLALVIWFTALGKVCSRLT